MGATPRLPCVSIRRSRTNSFPTGNRAGRAVGPGESIQWLRPRGAHRACDESAIAGNVGPPPGVQLRLINTRVFQLDYDTRVFGRHAHMPVELWGMRDGGNTWQSFGRDPKGQSPMLVTVPEEGIYGFRMAVQNGPARREGRRWPVTCRATGSASI